MTELWLPHFNVWQELNKQREFSRIKLIKVNENVTTVQMKLHLHIDVGCSMNFTDFPNDKQHCNFVMYDEDYNNTEILMETILTSGRKLYNPGANSDITVTPGDFTPYTNVSSSLLLELLSSINGSSTDTILGLYHSPQIYPRKDHFTHYHRPPSNGSFKRCTSIRINYRLCHMTTT